MVYTHPFNPVDRGWNLAVFYRENKSKKFGEFLKEAQKIGDFANLLDENAEVVYRNIIREQELLAFWPILKFLSGQKKGVEFFINGTSLSAFQTESILECRKKHWEQTFCQDYIEPKDRLGCGPGILFKLDTKWPGRFWFEFYRWKRRSTFILDRPAINAFFFQEPKHKLCFLSRKKQIDNYLNFLPDEIDFLREFKWSFSIKGNVWPSWAKTLAHQELLAISSELPSVGDLLFLEKNKGKIVLNTLGGKFVGNLVKESLSVFSLLDQEKILAQVLKVEAYYFQFKITPILNEVPPPTRALPKRLSLHPYPKETAEYQKFLAQFFDEE